MLQQLASHIKNTSFEYLADLKWNELPHALTCYTPSLEHACKSRLICLALLDRASDIQGKPITEKCDPRMDAVVPGSTGQSRSKNSTIPCLDLGGRLVDKQDGYVPQGSKFSYFGNAIVHNRPSTSVCPSSGFVFLSRIVVYICKLWECQGKWNRNSIYNNQARPVWRK
jgi:hypothetical protein